MFKKSLVAVAALATFSAGAMAANVELYGVVDMGFSYTHTSHQEKGDKFEMSQNMYAGSRFVSVVRKISVMTSPSVSSLKTGLLRIPAPWPFLTRSSTAKASSI